MADILSAVKEGLQSYCNKVGEHSLSLTQMYTNSNLILIVLESRAQTHTFV